MSYNKVQIQTKDKIFLFGMMKQKDFKKCIMYIPGLSGNYFNTEFMNIIAENSNKNGYDFLFTHNRGSFQLYDFVITDDFGKNSKKLIGSAYELFKDSSFDMEAWYNFLINKNYEEIVIIAHSRGCNKIIEFLSNFKFKNISKIILLAPQDNVNFKKLSIHKDMYEEAKENLKNDNAEKILSKKFLGFSFISGATYIDEVENMDLNNIPYKNLENDFKKINSINLPIYIIIGDEDIGENGEVYLTNMQKKCKNQINFKIMFETNHNFKNKENHLAELIYNIINDISLEIN